MTTQPLSFQRRHPLCLSLAQAVAVVGGVARLANLTRTFVVQIQARGKQL